MNLKQYKIGPVVLLYMIFPLTFSIGKAGMLYAPSTFFIAVRMLLSGICMLGIFTLMHKKQYLFSLEDAGLFLQASLFGIYFTYLPEFWALQYLSVAKSAFLFVLAPFFTALFAWLSGIEVFSRKKIIGLMIGMLGFVPIFLINTDKESSFKHFFSLNLPEIATIFSVACYAYSWIVVKDLVEKKDYSPFLVNGITMTIGGLGALVTSFFFDRWIQIGGMPVSNWSSLSFYMGLIVLVGMICYFLYSHLLKNFSATLISFFGFTEPFWAALYGWFFLGEEVFWIFFVSVFIVSVGLYLFYQEELKLG